MELRLTVPDKRSLGHFNVVCAIVLACVGRRGGKKGQWGWIRDLKVGRSTLSMGPARVKVLSYVQRVTFPSKRVVYTLKYSKKPHMQ
jgi:hypothetical protein